MFRNFLTAGLLFAAILPAAAQKNTPGSSSASPDSVIQLSGDQKPQFRGGQADLEKYFAKNLHYPESARRKKIQGNVVVGFLINEKGECSNFRIVQSLDKSCDAEALRVLKEMPDWKPARVNNKAVATQMQLPVSFRLDNTLNFEDNSKTKNKFR